MGKGLTEKQKRFVDEYVIDPNATRAYSIAYPKADGEPKAVSTCGSEGHKLLQNPKIKKAIDERLQTMRDSAIATAYEVEAYLTSVMRGTSRSETVVIEGHGDGLSQARLFTKPPDESERLKAAQMLAKRHQLLDSRVEVTGGVNVVLVDDIED